MTKKIIYTTGEKLSFSNKILFMKHCVQLYKMQNQDEHCNMVTSALIVTKAPNKMIPITTISRDLQCCAKMCSI